MADQQEVKLEDDVVDEPQVSEKLIQQFKQFIIQCGCLMLNGSSTDLQSSITQPKNQLVIDNFIRNDDTTLVLQKQVVSDSSDEKTTHSYTYSSEVPQEIFQNNTLEEDIQILVLMKYQDRPLNETVPFYNQLTISQMNPKTPFQSMLSYIRQAFVPVTSMCVNQKRFVYKIKIN